MRILDRHVIFAFLKNYLISFFVLVGMYIVLDMIFKFDELVEVREQATGGMESLTGFIAYVADFYSYQVFLYFVHLSGMITVVAAAFTLIRMVRFNELSALLSAGVPLLRVAFPIIGVAVVLQGLLLIDQELIIPRIIPQLVRKHDYAAKETNAFSIDMMRVDQTSLLSAARYFPDPRRPRMVFMDVIYRDAEHRPVAKLKADEAVWDGKRWKLVNGQVDRNLNDPDGVIKSDAVEIFESASVNPTEIQLFRSGNFVEMLSTRRINELLKRPRSFGREDLLRVKHARAAMLVVNVVLLLLAISCILTREPQQLKTAATRCVLWCGACLSVAFVGQQLAGQAPPGSEYAMYWPALMCWLPVFVFGPVAVWLLDRVRT
jgi:lipopolysaccharide export LptBFGC system permease protein LptF